MRLTALLTGDSAFSYSAAAAGKLRVSLRVSFSSRFSVFGLAAPADSALKSGSLVIILSIILFIRSGAFPHSAEEKVTRG